MSDSSLPGVLTSTPRERDFYRLALAQDRVAKSTVLFALEELRAGLGDDFYRDFPWAVERMLAVKLERRAQEETERAARRSRDRVRRAAIVSGDAESLSIFDDGYSSLNVPGEKRERHAPSPTVKAIPADEPPADALGINEAAELAAVSRSLVEKWIRLGELPAWKVGPNVYVQRPGLEALTKAAA